MSKTKNTSVRFDTEQLALLKKTYPELSSGQQCLDFLMSYWYNRVKQHSQTGNEVLSSKPSIFDMLPDSMKRRLK